MEAEDYSLLTSLRPHCDLIDPLPPGDPEAALFVAMWALTACFSTVCLCNKG